MPSALLLRLLPDPDVVPGVVEVVEVVVAAVNKKNGSSIPLVSLQMSIVNIHWLSRHSTSSVEVAAVTYDVDVVVSVTMLMEVQPEKRKRPFRSAAAEDCTSSSSVLTVLKSELMGRQTSIQYSV